MAESLEEVMEKYKLSEEEHNKKQEQINNIMLYDKYPVENPIAIIDIAPPASGKTGLNGYGQSEFLNNNVVIINSDELKPFHPKVDEIARLYPQYYTKVTDQESNTWTSTLFEKALSEGYNVIFEGTGRNARILKTIEEKMKNYSVIVRALSVCDLNCLLSLIERYENQVATRGWGRLVTLNHFYETYDNMPGVIDEIEKSKLVDYVEVFERGETPTQPNKIYKTGDKSIGNGKYPNARFAILDGRVEDQKKAIEDYESRMKNLIELLKGKEISPEERNVVYEIRKTYEFLTDKKKSNKDIREK